MRRIYRRGMTTASGGNVSIRDEKGIWITPAGVDKGSLAAGDIVFVDDNGSITGRRRPSSELPVHVHAYRKRPDLRAIVHAHPPALVAFSLSHQAPDTRLLPEAFDCCGRIGYASYEPTGTERLGRSVARVLADGCHCVLMENHGVVAGGRDAGEAYERLEMLEWTATIRARAAALGTEQILTDEKLALFAAGGADTAPGDLPPATASESAQRATVCDLARRAYERRLTTSRRGSLSARLDDRTFVITPRRADRESMEPGDLVRCSATGHEPGKTPDRGSRLHGAIYAAHPEINAVAGAGPPCATAFSVTGTRLDSRTIPESLLLLGEVATIPYEVFFTRPERVAEIIRPRRLAALVEHQGALAAGASTLEAFDRLEVLEATAAALIEAASLGPVHTLSERAVTELEQAAPRGRPPA